MKRYLTILAVLGCIVACGGSEPETGGEGGGKTEVPVPASVALSSAGETSLSFSWAAVSGASSYQWRLLKGITETSKGSVQGTSVTVSGLEQGTTYKFAVKAVSEGSSSSWSSYVEAATSSSSNPDSNPGTGDLLAYSEFSITSAEEDGTARAFPGAEGGGMYTTGGRGGKVIHVTNLNDKGEGSLRAALTASGARTVVFDVAGVIELESRIQIKNGDLTIAGQTAPGGGICIKNYTINVDADNVIIRFLHFRLGDEGPNAGDSEDCIWGRYHSNIIIDHCSMSWSIDECASFYANEYFSLQWCILTESMNNSAHSKGSHGYGGIWGGKDASFHHNLLANHHSRNPRIDHPEIYPKSSGEFDWSKRGNVDLRNLVIYNWGDNSTYGGEGGSFNIVGCYYKPGPDSKDRHYFVDAYSIYSSSKTNYGYPSLYFDGNIHSGHDDISSNNLVHGVYFHESGSYDLPSGYSFLTAPLPVSGASGKTAYVTTHSAEGALSAVLDWAGDRLHRDSVDERAVSGVKSNTGKIIDTPSDVGGWPSYSATAEEKARAATDSDSDGIPDYYEDLFGLDKNNSSDAAAVSLDTKGRYSNLEMYLHYLVREIVASQTSGGSYGEL